MTAKRPHPLPKLALQLKLTLRFTEPAVWRRVLVADDLSFWDLHIAIQGAMGWTESHHHQFTPAGSRRP